jgi:hypothetical protein
MGGFLALEKDVATASTFVVVATVLAVLAVAFAFWQEGLRRPVLLMEILVLLGFMVFGLLSLFGAVRGSWAMMILGWVIGSAIMLTGLYLGKRSTEKEKALEKEVKKELGVQDEMGELIKGKTARAVLVIYFFSLIPMLSVCMIMDIPQAVMLFLAQFFVLAITYDIALWYYYRKKYR